MPRNPISCRRASYGEFESVAYEHLASLGVKHVEIEVPAPDQLDAARAELQKWNLSAMTLHGEVPVTQADCGQRVAAQMPAFAALGTKLMFISCQHDDTPLDTVYGRLREAGDIAAEHGVTIVVETHPELFTNGAKALETVTAVNHPHVRVNYDTANVYFYNEGCNGIDELKQVIHYVAAVHLKDTNGAYRTWHFPALGQGIVDFPAHFELLDKIGYAGPYTLEVEGIEGQTDTAETVQQRIADSIEYLRGLERM